MRTEFVVSDLYPTFDYENQNFELIVYLVLRITGIILLKARSHSSPPASFNCTGCVVLTSPFGGPEDAG